MRNDRLIIIVLTATLLLATSAMSTGEQITRYVISTAGGTVESDLHRLTVTVGQPVVGFGTSPDYGLSTGFYQSSGNPVCCMGLLRGNVDYDQDDICDGGDLTRLIDYLFISFEPLPCPAEANIAADPDDLVDVGDLTALISNLRKC